MRAIASGYKPIVTAGDLKGALIYLSQKSAAKVAYGCCNAASCAPRRHTQLWKTLNVVVIMVVLGPSHEMMCPT